MGRKGQTGARVTKRGKREVKSERKSLLVEVPDAPGGEVL